MRREPTGSPLPERGSDELLVLTPVSLSGASAAAAGGWLLASLAWSLSTLVKFTGSINPVIAAGDLLVYVVLVWLAVRSRGRHRLELANDQLLYTRPRGTRSVLRVGQPGRVVELDVHLGGSTYGHTSQMWFIRLDDQTVPLKINRRAWDHAELERLRQRLQLSLEIVPGVQSGEQANARYPGLIQNWALHPWRTATLASAALIVVATIISLVLNLAPHH